MAMSKQSEGERGASTAMGDSPLRPYRACNRSACSVLVGRPVDGPPRCTSMTSSGSSVITARPTASLLSATPGPEVLVTPRAPPNEAPRAAPIPAISSSAWKVSTSKFLYLLSSCRMSEAGVIGYVPSTTLVFASLPAATTPYAIAVLPETCRYSPAGSDALATS
ncbi:Uncharacterised protein [Mycobacteroides abscessus subsp. abscessus]|nr:Uncharacterised protein [Mycobacteroides abscessus subsp. abscessus]